jgi:hypothetical protein
MINDMNAFELSDEQLAEVAGGSLGVIIAPKTSITVVPQLNISTSLTNVIAPQIVTAFGLHSPSVSAVQTLAGIGNSTGQGNQFK